MSPKPRVTVIGGGPGGYVAAIRAAQLGAQAADLADMIHAHPTMAEAMMEAAEDVAGEAIHQPPKKNGKSGKP